MLLSKQDIRWTDKYLLLLSVLSKVVFSLLETLKHCVTAYVLSGLREVYALALLSEVSGNDWNCISCIQLMKYNL